MQANHLASAARPGASRQLTLDGITKRFKDTVALQDISLAVQPGELIALLGPSGCGKTTTLRLIAGFDFPDEGAVRIDGQDISHLPPNKRGLGMVFQNYSLFPHLTVAQNIGFGLKMAGAPKDRIATEVNRLLELIRLSDFGDRDIAQLSGGQQQRVALARAIVTNPSVLLLDEPLGALDKNLREGMQFEIRRMQQSLGITSVMVTHDQEEAMTMSDRIVVMSQGRILQVGRPDEVYDYPRTRFVAEFLGTANILACRLNQSNGPLLELSILRQDDACLHANGTDTAVRLSLTDESSQTGWLAPGATVEIAIRPEKLRIGGTSTAGGVSLSGTVEQHVFRGSLHSYRVTIPAISTTLIVNQSADSRKGAAYQMGDAITVSFDADAAVLLQPEDVATRHLDSDANPVAVQRKAA